MENPRFTPHSTVRLKSQLPGMTAFPSKMQPWHNLIVQDTIARTQLTIAMQESTFTLLESTSTDNICLVSSPYVESAFVSESALRAATPSEIPPPPKAIFNPRPLT